MEKQLAKRRVLDYSKTVIYTITLNHVVYYVGSTSHFTDRKAKHKSHCNNIKDPEYNYVIYKYMREHGWTGRFEQGAWEIIIIENYPCKTKKEKHTRERYWYDIHTPSLNTNVPNRGQQEYNKMVGNSVMVECVCESIMRRSNHLNHSKTCQLCKDAPEGTKTHTVLSLTYDDIQNAKQEIILLPV